MPKFQVLAPLLVGVKSYTAAVLDNDGCIWAGKLNLDTWCQTPASFRCSKNVYPSTIKSRLRPLSDSEWAVLNKEHPNFSYNFVWGGDE